mmetsp:Transcript_34387/g.97409  ORF Transcript_34387/g.97409 Transcript_34387/m.97409 type:complete len:315 (-) Transcript_34387:317-1261(-)|eukprot:CAMPEP_0117666890 /NCGR_PEP_ID=MMETSP0804-20121206/10637_1 /TAXON_ID=1074897 /ORGANISM="Tetraselmis astigmatica, Strain CCMP880" /LENGTH=314 /DNA_ID=CAMNT_0005474505 /DNA_START=378 /DNA_END=1322 /DNA_ORIENTATION=+
MDARTGLAISGTAVAVCLGLRWGLHLAIRPPPPTKLSMEITGLPPKKGTPVLAMLAGFPDDHGTWSMIAPRFASTHTVVSMCMPDYDTKELQRYWGYPIPKIVDMLEESMKEAVPEGDKATLVVHDWGAFIGLQYLLREASLKCVDRLVLMDVGPKPKGSLGNWVAIITYQTYLSTAFLVSRLTLNIFGDIMMALFPWKLIGPCPYETVMPPRTSGPAGSRMAYPYFWTQMALLFAPSTLRSPKPAGSHPTGPLSLPTTFVYGKNKRATFHTEDFLQKLEATDSYKAVGLDCGHFIQVQKPDELESIIRERMAM